MKYKYYFLLFAFICNFSYQANAIDASIDYAVFNSKNSPYLELYLQILSKSVGFKVLDNGYAQSTVSIFVLIRTENGDSLFNDRITLNSPNESSIVPDYKHVMRYALQNGNYLVDVEITDLLKNSKIERSSFNLNISFNDKMVQQSMIQLLSSVHSDSSASIFSKNGMYYEVLPYSFCNNLVEELLIYNEVYNTLEHLNTDFVTHTWISRKARKKVIIERKKRTKAKDVVVIITSLDIRDLPSGNYEFHVDILNKEGKLISSEVTGFQRLNLLQQVELTSNTNPTMEFFPTWIDTLSKASLRYSLKAVFPLLEYYDVERLNQALSDNKQKRQKHFLYNFWARKAKDHEFIAYERYMKVARAVDKTFYSGFGHGFETDRGVIFMRYGQPDNSVSIDNEPGAFPYEIWKYNKLHTSGQTNVKLIFYNPSLASNAYLLLHSNAEGETRNIQWESHLYKGTSDNLPANSNIRTGDGIMRHAKEYYEGM